MLCRGEAVKVYERKREFDALGCTLACVLKEGLPAEVEEFKRDFWPEHLYLDEDKAFFKAVGGGKLKKGSLSAILNPFSRIWKHAGDAKKAGVKEHNLNGEGLITGGMFVMKPGSQGVQYQFQERNLGDHAPIEDVLAAAKAASEASK